MPPSAKAMEHRKQETDRLINWQASGKSTAMATASLMVGSELVPDAYFLQRVGRTYEQQKAFEKVVKQLGHCELNGSWLTADELEQEGIVLSDN